MLKFTTIAVILAVALAGCKDENNAPPMTLAQFTAKCTADGGVLSTPEPNLHLCKIPGSDEKFSIRSLDLRT